MKDKLNFALVGCGRIAQRYSDIFANDQLRNARLVAVSDANPPRAEKLAQKHKVPAFDDFRMMMEKHRRTTSTWSAY